MREFKSFGSMVSTDGFMEAELKYSPRGFLSSLWRNREMTTDVKTGMILIIVELTVFYESESRVVLNVRQKRMVEVFDMECLRELLWLR